MNREIKFGGTDIELDGEGFLWLPHKKILVVSDIHFEKSTFFSKFGTFLPPYDTLNDLQRLYDKINFYRPDKFIALGDSFHDLKAFERMKSEEKSLLNNIINSVGEWVWITGNHDEVIEGVNGKYHDEYFAENINFTHIAQPEYEGFEISGHYHPKVKVNISGHTISAPCFLISGKKIIMPSFGSFTGGLFINHAELLQLIPEEERNIFAIKQGRVFPISRI